jgi:cytochrome c peroxidase
MLGKHRIGFSAVLVLVLVLASTALAGAQTTLNLPLVVNEEQTASSPAEPLLVADEEGELTATGFIPSFDLAAARFAAITFHEGRKTFRFDTFGSESFWGGALRLHEAVAGEENDGVGPGLSPSAALALGLKVDERALPFRLKRQLQREEVDLDDPAVTLALLKLDAVVGVTGFFDEDGNIESLGIQCALCHSTVDDDFAPGIGHRLDGWANRDLNIGAIVALAPNLAPFADLLGVDQATVRTVLNSWGPGKFDAELILDGKAFQPDGRSAATLLPPAFGLAGVNLHTWTGWGSVTHWNAFVANLEMHGQGTFYDPRLNDATKFPIAAREGFGNVRNDPDLITEKLAALHLYQLALPAPKPPEDFFNSAAAARGEDLFNGKAECAVCHVPPLYTEPGWNMHTPEEIGIDDFQAKRSPDERYRTAPLKGLWTHMKGGFYHDGRFATLLDVINHYDAHFQLGLSGPEKADLVEFLKSLGDVEVPSH